MSFIRQISPSKLFDLGLNLATIGWRTGWHVGSSTGNAVAGVAGKFLGGTTGGIAGGLTQFYGVSEAYDFVVFKKPIQVIGARAEQALATIKTQSYVQKALNLTQNSVKCLLNEQGFMNKLACITSSMVPAIILKTGQCFTKGTWGRATLCGASVLSGIEEQAIEEKINLTILFTILTLTYYLTRPKTEK